MASKNVEKYIGEVQNKLGFKLMKKFKKKLTSVPENFRTQQSRMQEKQRHISKQQK